jgi:hypothetical protein
MTLGKDACTESRTAKLEVSERTGATNNAGLWRAEAATAAVADPAQRPLWRRHYRIGGTAKQIHESVRCRFGEARPGKRLFSQLRPGDRSEPSA